MSWRRLMSWLMPRRVEVARERVAAMLAETERAREIAEETAQEVVASANDEQRKLEATRAQIRRRSDERRERARLRAAHDPSLGAVTEALKLLERRN